MTSLVYVGFTQDRVPLGIRERLHADRARRAALVRACGAVAEGMVLSTCERFEFYAAASRSAEAMIEVIAREFGFSPDVLRRHAQVLHDDATTRHLLEVSAGLRSRIPGERQILRQVRSAYLDAAEDGTCGMVLDALCRAAIHAGRLVRRSTALGRGGPSAVGLAIERLSSALGDLAGRSVVVIGTGELAAEAVARLGRRRVARLHVVSRSRQRAEAFAARCGGVPGDVCDLPGLVRTIDGVIACSSAGFVIDRATMADRPARLLRIIDLGVPRNVDPDVAPLPGVRLTHLENLHPFDRVSPEALAQAGRIIDGEVDRFVRWRRGRRVAAEVADLVRRSRPGTDLDRRALHARIMRLKAQVAA